MDNEDLTVPVHQSMCLCKSVHSSLRPSYQLCAEWATDAVPLGLGHGLNQYFDIFIGEGLHNMFNLSSDNINGRAMRREEHVESLLYSSGSFIPALYMKTYHLAHFQAVEGKKAMEVIL